MEDEIKYIKEKLDDIYIAIMGDPTDATKLCLNVRIDRLEQSNILKSKIIFGLIIGVAGALGQTIASFF